MPLSFSDALLQLPSFVADNTASLDLACDWVCEMTELNIADSKQLWHEFWVAYWEAYGGCQDDNWHTVA